MVVLFVLLLVLFLRLLVGFVMPFCLALVTTRTAVPVLAGMAALFLGVAIPTGTCSSDNAA